MSDAITLLAAEAASRTDYTWAISFSVRLHESLIDLSHKQHCPDCNEEISPEDFALVTDTITVGAGDDAQAAVDAVRVHVFTAAWEEKTGVKLDPNSFRLMGVKLLAYQEI